MASKSISPGVHRCAVEEEGSFEVWKGIKQLGLRSGVKASKQWEYE